MIFNLANGLTHSYMCTLSKYYNLLNLLYRTCMRLIVVEAINFKIDCKKLSLCGNYGVNGGQLPD